MVKNREETEMETKEAVRHREDEYGAEHMSGGDIAKYCAAVAVLVAMVVAVLLAAHLWANLGGSRDSVACTGKWPDSFRVEPNDNPTTIARKRFPGVPEQMVADAIANLNPEGINRTGGYWVPNDCDGHTPTQAVR